MVRHASFAALCLVLILAGCVAQSKRADESATARIGPVVPAASGDPLPAALPPIDPAADWPLYGAGLDGTHAAGVAAGISAKNVALLRPAWNVSLGPISGSPIVADRRVIVADMTGNVTALDAASGEILWQRNVGDPVSGTPAISNGLVFAVTLKKATLFAIDAMTGTLRWSEPIAPTSAGWGSPVVVDDLVVVGASGGDDGYAPPDHRGSIQAFDASSGKLSWRTFVAGELTPGSSVWTTPAAWGDLLFVGTGNPNGDPADPDPHADSMVALWTKNGTIAWSRQFFPNSGTDRTDDDFGSSPIVYALEDGEEVVAEAQKYGQIHLVDAENGTTLADRSEYAQDVIASPALGDGCLFLVREISDASGYLDCLSMGPTPTPLWSIPLGPSYSSPATAPGVVFVAEIPGRLTAFSTATEARLWSANLPGQTYSSPAIAEGHVYIGYQTAWGPTGAGGVIAYAPEPVA